MIITILWIAVSILTWPFLAKWLAVNVPVGNPTSTDYYMATAMGFVVAFTWPMMIPVLLIVFVGKRIIFGSTE